MVITFVWKKCSHGTIATNCRSYNRLAGMLNSEILKLYTRQNVQSFSLFDKGTHSVVTAIPMHFSQFYWVITLGFGGNSYYKILLHLCNDYGWNES